MDHSENRHHLGKYVGAFGAILISAMVALQSTTIWIFAVPVILLALVPAGIGLAVLEAAGKGGSLRYHVLIGAAVGMLCLLVIGMLLASAEVENVSLLSIDWSAFARVAVPAAAFGAWSGFVWWAAFWGRARLARTFADENLLGPHRDDW